MIRSIGRSVAIRVASRILFVILLAVFAFFSKHAFAQSTDSCSHEGASWYKYRVSGTTYGGDTGYVIPNRDAMCSFGESHFCATRTTGTCATAYRPWHGTTGTACATAVGSNIFSFPGARQVQTDPPTNCPADAPPEVTCVLPEDPELGIANFADLPAENLDPIACDVGSNCLVSKRPGTTVCGPTVCGAIYSYLDIPGGGGACDGATVPEDDTPPELADPDGPPAPAERCETQGGAEYCVATGDEDGNDAQCGFLNDQWICVTATPDNGCQAVVGGGVLCDPEATAPPAPDNGTPGVEATPDGQVSTSANGGNTTNNYNYYDNDTVNNSNGGVVTGHVDPGNDQNGDGFTDGDEEEGPRGTASGGAACDAAPVCEGDAIACAALYQAWRARCPVQPTQEELYSTGDVTTGEAAGIGADENTEEVEVGEFSSTGIWSPGSCPAAVTVNVMGSSLGLDIWGPACSMATTFAPFVMAMAYLLAVLLVVKEF